MRLSPPRGSFLRAPTGARQPSLLRPRRINGDRRIVRAAQTAAAHTRPAARPWRFPRGRFPELLGSRRDDRRESGAIVQTNSVVECRRRGWSRRRSGSRRAPAARPAVGCWFPPIRAMSSSRIRSPPLSGRRLCPGSRSLNLDRRPRRDCPCFVRAAVCVLSGRGARLGHRRPGRRPRSGRLLLGDSTSAAAAPWWDPPREGGVGPVEYSAVEAGVRALVRNALVAGCVAGGSAGGMGVCLRWPIRPQRRFGHLRGPLLRLGQRPPRAGALSDRIERCCTRRPATRRGRSR